VSHETAGDPRSPEFLRENKRFYVDVEDYDWVEATDRIVGLESFFHRFRQRTVRGLLAEHGAPPYLDAACGTGLILRHLPPGSVGIDINARNIAKACQHAAASQPMLADMEALPFRDGAFATAIASEVLEHLPNAEVALAELWRILRPGGKLVGSVPSDSFAWKLRFLSSTCGAKEPYHKNYRGEELRQLLGSSFQTFDVRAANVGMSLVFVAEK
jgi:SAM-dependent methyltransferase